MPGRQSVLAPMGPAAERIAELWWVMLVLAALVAVVVLALTAWALFHRREDGEAWRRNPAPAAGETVEASRARSEEPLPGRGLRAPTPEADRRTTRWILAGGILAPVVLLTALFVFTLIELRALAAPGEPALVVEISGRQWWWEVTYPDSVPGRRVVTANEIHIPAGRRVEVRLRSEDVIHSFWVPELQGKLDLIPGQTNVTWIEAERPGVFRGQCAEYCGLQHARMGLLVVAQPPDEFQRWLARQRAPATTPDNPMTARGREVFEVSACALCHTIRGTRARGTVGPDLTHLASRRTVAAVTVPNDRAGLGGWVANPQGIKPGARMPAVPLAAEDYRALLRYLETLR